MSNEEMELTRLTLKRLAAERDAARAEVAAVVRALDDIGAPDPDVDNESDRYTPAQRLLAHADWGVELQEEEERAALEKERDAALAEVARLKLINAALISDLADMVNQHCTDNRDGTILDGALSANEDAIARLVELGVPVQVSEKPIRWGWKPEAQS